MSSNNSNDVVAKCESLVRKHFKDKPFESPFALGDFIVSNSNGLLADLLRGSMKVPIPRDPSDPDGNKPCLLLHDLENQNHRDSDVYKFIDNNNDISTGLYGTSGAGKTRSVFEYLSHNFGLYFVASTRNDAGSRDLERLLQLFRNLNIHLLAVGNSQNEQFYKNNSRLNYATMERYVLIIVWVRHVVFKTINRQLLAKNRKLTPYQWLLIQLFPIKALGSDIFEEVTASCITSLGENDVSVVRAIVEDPPVWSVMAVDEAQELSRKLNGHFLSEDGKIQRSAFSALLRAMDNAAGLPCHDKGFPLFSGTGMSIDDFLEQSRSVMAKRFLEKDWNFVFTEFQPLTTDAVKTYLESFLELNLGADHESPQVPNSSALEHVAKWLRGRPRWAATFLEVYLVREQRETHNGTRGNFSSEAAKLVEALDRYLAVHTTDGNSRRTSFTPKKGSAYTTIAETVRGHENLQVRKTLERAIFKFAVGGRAVVLHQETKRLIEVGVAALRKTGAIHAILDEPIIIEAGINFFSLDDATLDNMNAQEDDGQGTAFEKVILPAIQRKFVEVLSAQLGEDGRVLREYSVPSKSSYGVLAVQCKSVSSTIDWIEKGMSSTFEGEVAPFCYPDTAIGPDLMFFMRNKAFTKFVSVIAQAKYRKRVDQMEALRSITPSLLYHQHRGKENQATSTALPRDNTQFQRWEKLKPVFLGVDHGCVRLMVQYPSYSTKSASPGTVGDDETKVQNSKKRKRGWLATVSRDNASTLFTGDALRMFDALKQADATVADTQQNEEASGA